MITCHMTYRRNDEDRCDTNALDWVSGLAEAVAEVRAHWHEEDGPQHYLFAEEGTGRHLASMFRGPTPDVCLTLHADGSVERHSVRYLTAPDGSYFATEIVPLDASLAPCGPPAVVDALAPVA